MEWWMSGAGFHGRQITSIAQVPVCHWSTCFGFILCRSTDSSTGGGDDSGYFTFPSWTSSCFQFKAMQPLLSDAVQNWHIYNLIFRADSISTEKWEPIHLSCRLKPINLQLASHSVQSEVLNQVVKNVFLLRSQKPQAITRAIIEVFDSI